jgi:hypothetical protein
MNAIENSQTRELSAAEVDDVSGGFIWIGVFAAGALIGYGIRRGGEAIADYFGDDD